MTESYEVRRRAGIVLAYMNTMSVYEYRESLIRAAALAAGWIPFPYP